MENFARYIDITFKAWILVMIGLAWDNPEWVGEWKANVDIAYDQIWSEYIIDCDCTELLE